MTEIPAAIVESPRPSLRPKPERANAIRKLVAVGIIVGACFVGWKLVKPWLRSDSTKRLEARQDKARDKVGRAIDELFARQLDVNSTTIDLVARFDVAPELGGGYDPVSCGWGFDDAFGDALGPGVVTVSTFGIMPELATRLVITANIRPSGLRLQSSSSTTTYPGIVLTANMTFLGKELHVEVKPATHIAFEHLPIGVDGLSAADVAGGVMQSTCKQLGYALLEALTAWKRPRLPRRD
jgi:hypothetical protein